MGYAVVPDIKSEAIVCQKPCQHTDCKANREEWTDARCELCGKPMLPGQNYYREDGHVHAGCLYDKKA